MYVYWTKNSFNVTMSSFFLFISVLQREVGSMGWFKYSKGRGEANIVQDGAVDLQHRTGMDGNSHPCVQGHHPQVRVCALKKTNKPTKKLLNPVHNKMYFSPLQVKNKPREAALN
jgi:hypothetical protein